MSLISLHQLMAVAMLLRYEESAIYSRSFRCRCGHSRASKQNQVYMLMTFITLLDDSFDA